MISVFVGLFPMTIRYWQRGLCKLGIRVCVSCFHRLCECEECHACTGSFGLYE